MWFGVHFLRERISASSGRIFFRSYNAYYAFLVKISEKNGGTIFRKKSNLGGSIFGARSFFFPTILGKSTSRLRREKRIFPWCSASKVR